MKNLLLLILLAVSSPCWALYDCTESNGRDVRHYQSSAPCDTTFMPMSRARQYIQNKSMEIPITGGHFRTMGSINGRPVAYMIDTGATITSVSARVASSLGIAGCQSMGVTQTANGRVRNCRVVVSEIVVGSFRVHNVPLSILPAMADELLLGMDVLRRFEIYQNGQVMRISTKR